MSLLYPHLQYPRHVPLRNPDDYDDVHDEYGRPRRRPMIGPIQEFDPTDYGNDHYHDLLDGDNDPDDDDPDDNDLVDYNDLTIDNGYFFPVHDNDPRNDPDDGHDDKNNNNNNNDLAEPGAEPEPVPGPVPPEPSQSQQEPAPEPLAEVPEEHEPLALEPLEPIADEHDEWLALLDL